MSLHRHAVRRDANEQSLVSLLRQLGATWQPLSVKGGPDGMAGFQGQNYLIEIKRPGQKLRLTQQTWAENWCGSPVHVLRTPEDIYRLLRIKT